MENKHFTINKRTKHYFLSLSKLTATIIPYRHYKLKSETISQQDCPYFLLQSHACLCLFNFNKSAMANALIYC